MRKQTRLHYHKAPLGIMKNLQKPMQGQLHKEKSPLDGCSTKLYPDGKSFGIKCNVNIFAENRHKLDVGKTHKKILFENSNTPLILESLYLSHHNSQYISGSVDFFYTQGYSKAKRYYYRLIVPITEKYLFHYQLKEVSMSTDLGYRTRFGTIATINKDALHIGIVHDAKNQSFLSIESWRKQSFYSFSEKTFAIKNALGFLTGYMAGDQGYFFAYDKKEMEIPMHYYYNIFRKTIKSTHCPINISPFAWLHENSKVAEKYYKKKLLRTVNLEEFSLLCQRLYDSVDFSSVILLMLESSVASLLFSPGGYAIALESMSDIIIGNNKPKLAPIKDTAIQKTVVKECQKVINDHCSAISPDDLKALLGRIESNINQPTNKARLKAPFEMLGIELNKLDLQILESRNDFLHGRIPDITKAGATRSIDRKNRDLYYASMRFYTLLNILILKWIGYDNYVLNFPQIHKRYCKVKIKEAPYRKV